MAMLFISGVYVRDVEVEDFQDGFPCTWGDADHAYILHERKWWKASDRTVAMGDRKGLPICYWDKVHPKLVPAALRLYELILN